MATAAAQRIERNEAVNFHLRTASWKEFYTQYQEVILGTVMLIEGSIREVSWLKGEYFSEGLHRKLWLCLVRMESRNIHIDILNASYCYKKLYGENECYDISMMTTRVGGPGHLLSHCFFMVECWIREQAGNTLSEMCSKLDTTGDIKLMSLYNDLSQMRTEVMNMSGDTFDIINDCVQYLKANYEEEQISPFLLLVEEVLENINRIKQKLNLL